ncbi:MAG: hypothetical protein IPQ16_12080 [Geobacteraceae bacterium]|nr:hypothetical protein [Geobacteraceae bacterium]
MAKLGIRDVLLRELGMNVIVHSEGATAVIAVCSKTKINLKYSSNPVPVKAYANSCDADEYIQVVVADFGTGIISKLRNIFLNDSTATDVLNATDDESVIEYAFWKETTSRPTRAIDEMLDENEIGEEFVPPTGLHFVKRLIINKRGFMYVRSGKSLYAIDCSTGIERKVTYKEWNTRNPKDHLQYIPGNLIVLYIPTKDFECTNQMQLLDNNATGHNIKNYRYINACNQLIIACDMKTGAVNLLNIIRSEARKLVANQTLLVDFQCHPIDKKYLYKIIIYCMYIQETDKRIKLVDVSPIAELDILNESIVSISNNIKNLQPVYTYNTLVSKYSIIGDDKFENSFTLPSIETYIIKERFTSLERQLAHFYSSAKVLLPSPSKVYIEGYYELCDFINMHDNHSIIVSHIIDKLKTNDISVIIITSTVLDRVAKELSTRYGLSKDNVILYKDNFSPILASLIAIENFEKYVLILSDVIVTGNTLEKITNIIQHKTIVYTIIDGRQSTKLFLPNVYKVECLKRHIFKVSQTKPADWKYEEIHLIDAVSHKLIIETKNRSEALLDSELSLEDLVVNNNIIKSGHYCYTQTCYTYFFNTLVLQQVYKDEFIEILRKDIDEVCTRKLIETKDAESTGEVNYVNSKVTNICYPQNNTPAEAICDDLQTYIGGSVSYLPRMVTERGSVYSTSSFTSSTKSDVAIFIDTAATTSNTIKYAMDWASYIKAELLLIYIIINRMPADTASFVKGISRYKGVEVQLKSLFKEYLPAYTTLECPICMRTRRLESLSKQLMLYKCNKLFQDIIIENERIPIKDARNTNGQSSTDELNILYSQVYFRSMIENHAVNPSVLGSNKIAELINETKINKNVRYAVIRALERENEVFCSEKKYAQIFDAELKKILVNIAINISADNNLDDDLRLSAMWVASTIDHDMFITRLCSAPDIKLSNKTIKHLIALIMLNYEKTQVDSCCNLIEIIISKSTDCSDDNIIDALREAEFYFRFLPGIRSSDVGTYKDSIDILWSIFEETGLSHPRFRTKFDDVVRIVVQDNLESAVGYSYLSNDGFYYMLNDKILPAIQRVLSAWPKEYYSNSLYLQDQLRSDITDLDILLRRAYREYKRNVIASDKWDNYVNKIDEISRRLYDKFFNTDMSELKLLLKGSNISTNEITNIVINKYTTTCAEKQITTQIELIDNQIKIPHIVMEDIISTVYYNAIKYSDQGSTIIINTVNTPTEYCICVHSIDSSGGRPILKEGHGLYNCSILLKKIRWWYSNTEFRT